MGIGVSVFLMAVGAILTWGVNATARGLNLEVIGVILMIVGGLGLLLSLLFWSSFAPFGSHHSHESLHEHEVLR
jgi:hypothetical protein